MSKSDRLFMFRRNDIEFCQKMGTIIGNALLSDYTLNNKLPVTLINYLRPCLMAKHTNYCDKI